MLFQPAAAVGVKKAGGAPEVQGGLARHVGPVRVPEVGWTNARERHFVRERLLYRAAQADAVLISAYSRAAGKSGEVF